MRNVGIDALLEEDLLFRRRTRDLGALDVDADQIGAALRDSQPQDVE
jgi:hypothetical protein